MEWKWQYAWVVLVFTGIGMGAYSYFTEASGSSYIIPFLFVIVALVGKLLTDEN